MPDEIIPSDAPRSVATFTILSGGSAVPQEYHVLSLIVNKEVNRIPTATIILSDGEVAQQTFEISNRPDFEPGKEIEIKAGYQSDEQTIFKGIVIRHSIKIRKSNSVLVVECKDKAVKMTGAPKSAYYRDVKDSDILEELIDKYGLEKDVAATQVLYKQTVQYHSTDWDFMLCRCDANGLLCFVNDNKVSIAKPDFAGAAVLTVQYGATVKDLDAEIDARLQYKSIKGASWNYTDQELLDSVEAETTSVPDGGNLSTDTLAGVINEEAYTLYHSGKIEEPELQAWANAMMMRHQLARIRGRVRTDGTAAVRPGQLIQLNGVGERFQGKLYVTGVRHEVENGSWQTAMQFGINPEWFAQTYPVQQPLAGALLPAIQGLQMGIVTQLESDPDGEDRIQVRIPVISKADEGIWCRMATLDAGNSRGSFFRPEIGDEVVIGFINNDPRHAIILGMCNSSSKPAPITASDNNHVKGYVSRSSMKWLFDDDKKSISIETPGGNKMLISDDEKKIHLEDMNGNKLTMSEEGIAIESSKDIILKAPSSDVKSNSTNLILEGSAQATVKGGSGAELSAGGTTNVKGGIVNIN